MSEPTPVPDGYVPIGEYLTQNGVNVEQLRNLLNKYRSEQIRAETEDDLMVEFWEHSYLSEIETFSLML